MAQDAQSTELFWIDPKRRGILPLDRVHVPRRLRRTLRQNPFRIRCDTDFSGVMRGCAEPVPGRPDTWINAEIFELFVELHRLGAAHSVEAWEGDELVGGLYGLALKGAFFGESMFSRRTDASKIALVHLVARLIHGGFVLLDTQFVTEHLSQFGTVEIPRSDYRRRLARALTVDAVFQPELPETLSAGLSGVASGSAVAGGRSAVSGGVDPLAFLQSSSQTS